MIPFANPRPVTITGYSGIAMEPFITPDNQYLMFNNSNDAAVNTDIFYARKIDDITFQFIGTLPGANSIKLDGCYCCDLAGNAFLTSARGYQNADLRTIFTAKFTANIGLTGLRALSGDLPAGRPGWLTMDCGISADGYSLYFTDNLFSGGPAPVHSTMCLALRQPDGSFHRAPMSDYFFEYINDTDGLVYAPSISPDGMELACTYWDPDVAGDLPRIMIAPWDAALGCFGAPVEMTVPHGVEAPSFSGDGKRLYYHVLPGSIWVVNR